VTHKKLLILIVPIIAVGGIVTVVLLTGLRPTIVNMFSPKNILVDQATLDALPKKNGSSADVSRVAGSVIPPTNSWLSGMVLQDTPLPVYPMPLSFLAKDTGFEIGLPTIASTSTVISGGHIPGITATINGVTDFKLSRFDKVSATLNYRKNGQTIGNLTLAQGSPYVFFRAATDTTLSSDGIGSVVAGASDSYVRYSKAGHDYVITTDKDATIDLKGSTVSVAAPGGSLVTLYALPSSSKDTLRDFAGNELTSVNVVGGVDKTKSITTFQYKTANNQPTVFVPMSYSVVTNPGSTVMTYGSIYGPMNALSGSDFIVTTPLAEAANQLNLSVLTAAHKQQLIDSLKKDVAATSITAQDSYFAGKQLARAATLLDISEQLGQADTSAQLKSILRDGFSKRLGTDYFYYDTTLKGVAADTKAFGSEDFNDHHFHYGYFIYAASIFGRYDSDFLKQHQKQINLLVADIASYDATKNFPVQRNYDPYSAHSWAAGLSPFADGNNQESSSEAINAWNGVAKWGQLTNNSQLTDSAMWMLSGETATAKAAWRHVDTSSSALKNYTSPLTSLNFGGKRTYSTFFSDEANTKLGIQLLPLSPVMLNLSSDGSSIDSLIQASITNDNFNVALGDYDLMYLALRDPQKAAGLIATQHLIDDGNSLTYLQAWIYSLSDKK